MKDLEVSNAVYEKYKKDYKDNQDKTPEEIRKRLMRNIIIAAEDRRNRKKSTRIFIFGNMNIVLKDNIVIDLISLNRQETTWIMPRELGNIALEYIDKMENKKLLLV